MSAGRVDIRETKRNGKFRLRFYAVAPDHLEVILSALKVARQEMNTDYDSVALEAICLDFLESHIGMKLSLPKKLHSHKLPEQESLAVNLEQT